MKLVLFALNAKLDFASSIEGGLRRVKQLIVPLNLPSCIMRTA